MSRGIRLTGWFAAVNAVIAATALAVGLEGDGVQGVAAFVAWCSLG